MSFGGLEILTTGSKHGPEMAGKGGVGRAVVVFWFYLFEAWKPELSKIQKALEAVRR